MAKLNRKLYVRVFAVAVLICLISMVGAHVVNTNFGSIEVTDIFGQLVTKYEGVDR